MTHNSYSIWMVFYNHGSCCMSGFSFNHKYAVSTSSDEVVFH